LQQDVEQEKVIIINTKEQKAHEKVATIRRRN